MTSAAPGVGRARSSLCARPMSGAKGLSNGPYWAAPVQHARGRFEVRPSGVRFTVDPSPEVRWKSDAYRAESVRGRVTEFSERSRSRLRSAALDLGEYYSPDLLLTLTYSGQWRVVAPDGPSCRRHLKALRKRLSRYLASLGVLEWSALWFREFQRRGAPHFHLILWGPGLSVLDLRQARRWLTRAWTEIVDHPVASEKAKHRKAGTKLEKYRTDHFGYAVAYATKPHQKKVPDDFASPGRFWGLWQANVPRPVVFSVSVPLPLLVDIVDRLAATIEKHSPSYASKLRHNFADVTGSGWSFGARVFGRTAADVLLGFDFSPEQPPPSSVGPPRAAASPALA